MNLVTILYAAYVVVASVSHVSGEAQSSVLPDITSILKGAKIHCRLAKSYGKLTKSSLLQLDKDLQTVIGDTLVRMSRARMGNWHAIRGTMDISPFLERVPGTLTNKHNGMGFSNLNFFSSGGNDHRLQNAVKDWYTNFIGDTNVLADAGNIDVPAMMQLVGGTGVRVNSFGSVFHRTIDRHVTFVDIGVMRMPDIVNPYFQIYAINFSGFNRRERTFWMETKDAGVRGEFHSLKFKLRKDVNTRITGPIRKQAIRELNALFGVKIAN